ncbi:MAG TPA: hypothetical protein VG757_00605 [Devosia sp.]|nr:hypothetical protein [Devosia sp.]
MRALATLALGALATPALAAPTLTDGIYSCTLDGAPLGQIRIVAETYQGVAVGGTFGAAEMYITMDPDRIEWLGGLGLLDQQGYRVDHTTITGIGGRPGFEITLLKPDQSDFVTATCTL